jgi:hypothetical protein
MTFLDPTRKATNHLTAAKSYETLYREAGYFKRIELQEKDADLEKSAETLKSLARRLNDLNMASPRIPGRIYRVADRKLAAGRGEVVRDPAEIDTRIPERMQNS